MHASPEAAVVRGEWLDYIIASSIFVHVYCGLTLLHKNAKEERETTDDSGTTFCGIH